MVVGMVVTDGRIAAARQSACITKRIMSCLGEQGGGAASGALTFGCLRALMGGCGVSAAALTRLGPPTNMRRL